MLNKFVPLDRAVIRVSGEDRQAFLQGLISNDVTKIGSDQLLWAAFLSPQGKFQWDLFLLAQDDSILIDVDGPTAAAFAKRLGLYKLRSKVTVELTDLSVFATPKPVGLAGRDGRHADLGWRSYGALADMQASGLDQGDLADWDALRLPLGIADGRRDLEVDKSLLLEAGFEELGGVDFEKGCYMGQELTARTKYRALIKKRILPLRLSGDLPAGTILRTNDGQEAGEVRFSANGLGLGLIRLDHRAVPLNADGVDVSVSVPDWVVIPT